MTLPRNLRELVNESEVVVQGRVTNVTLEADKQLANLMTLVVTLQVEDTLKGVTGTSFTFRQAVIDKRDQLQKMGYRPGQRLLLTLIRPSAYGLSSPAGLQQGRFSISSGPDGKLQVTNGFANAGLFRDLESQLGAHGTSVSPQVHAMIANSKSGPLPLDTLKALIRSMAAPNSGPQS